MSTAANAAAQETQEQIDARLAEEAALSGEDFNPDEGGAEDKAPAASLSDAGNDSGATDDGAKIEYDADTLASIVGDEKPTTVPHARFNEVNQGKKAAEARVHELELQLARLNGKAEASAPKDEQKQEAAAYDFDVAEANYQDALLDGDKTKANAIRAEIRTHEREAARIEAEAAADRRYSTNKAADDAKRAKLEFDLEVSKAYSAFPFLNGESADANPEAIEEVLVWHQSQMGKGKSPAEAMAAAVARVAPRYAKPDEKETAAPVVKPDIQKGIDRANKVPSKPNGVGARASTLDVSKMTGKDLKSLSAEDEASLAGDIV
jgi:hypothetical protein